MFSISTGMRQQWFRVFTVEGLDGLDGVKDIMASCHRASDDAPLQVKQIKRSILSFLLCDGRRDADYGMPAWTCLSKAGISVRHRCICSGVMQFGPSMFLAMVIVRRGEEMRG
jgi:hypothetical protein